ncbi:hypothetical protein INR49_014135 [Caranx melampygus]|nr:hypothetical protein INR49_014135 [Caranx melampygus]
MMSLDPLKSVIAIGNVDDTSLAVPSVNQYGSGQRRVLEQVQTIRRTKSRQFSSRSGSTSLSPTSPLSDGVFVDTFKSHSGTSNGSVFFGNGVSKTLSLEKNMNRQQVNISRGTSMKMNTAASAYRYERGYAPISPVAPGPTNTTRSEPDMPFQYSVPKRSVPMQRVLSNKVIHRMERPSSQFISSRYQFPSNTNDKNLIKTNSQVIYSQTDSSRSFCKPAVIDNTVKGKGDSGVNGVKVVMDMMEAVEYLSSADETVQHCAASYIQHNTFVDDKTKDEVIKLNGIPPLVAMLRSPSAQVSQTASAALRNLSFKNNSAKEAIHRNGGITEAVALLRDTDSVEIQKQLTGLLWNLSPSDNLKPDLLKSALPVLMERVILPCTTGPDRAYHDPELLFNATGCLRNISSTKQNNRQAMRKCRGLVDCLVKYVSDCVEAGKPDDKSVENCVCILHNLTFQLEAEAPTLFSRITALAKTVKRSDSEDDTGPIGCFSPQSKPTEQERHFDFPVVEDPQPNGAGWLFHSKTLQSYLNLLETSQREETQEACSGALQNLTAQEGVVSAVMSQTIVQKLNGLEVITPFLKSDKVNLQRNAVALIGNLTKNPNLHSGLARKALPQMMGLISDSTAQGNESDDTLAMACQAANCLLLKEPKMGKHLLNYHLIKSLRSLSENKYFPKASKAASCFLYNLWSEKDLQSFLKKLGMPKSSFVNDITTTALKSVQVVQ